MVDERDNLESFSQKGAAQIRSDMRSVVLLALLGYAYLTGVVVLLIGACIFVVYLLLKWHSIYILKIAAIPLLILLALLKSFIVKIDPPSGLEIKENDAPELFKLISEVRDAAQSPVIHRVLLVSDFNCAIRQTPMLGVLGFYRNYLILGLPLMGAMTTAQFKAVLAHEMGHLSARHGKTSSWLYHVDQTWLQLVDNMRESGGLGIVMFRSFLMWFLPLFEKKVLGICRLQEYEADQLAAQLVGSDVCAQALALTEVKAMYLEDKFWPAQLAKTKEVAEPPRGMIAAASSLPVGSIADGDIETYFLLADDNHSENGTHPKLRDRVKALGVESDFGNLMQLFKNAEFSAVQSKSSADELLGASQHKLVESVEEGWRQNLLVAWKTEYENCQGRRELLKRLDEAAQKADDMKVEDVIERADLTAFFGDEARAIEMLRESLVANEENSELRYRLGHYLLEKDDEEGLLHVQKSLSLGRRYSYNCYQSLYNFYTRKKDHDLAKDYLQKANEAAESFVKAATAAMTVSPDEIFSPPDASSFKLERVKTALYLEPRVRQAYLVRRASIDRELLDGGDHLLVVQLGSPGRALLSEEDLLSAIPLLCQVPELSEYGILPVQQVPRKLRDACTQLPEALVYDRNHYEQALADSGVATQQPKASLSGGLKNGFLERNKWIIAGLVLIVVSVMLAMAMSSSSTVSSTTDSDDHRNEQEMAAANGKYSAYMSRLERAMKAKWHPPASNKRCLVRVFFKIDRDGNYSDLKIVKSSGNKLIDLAARDAVKNAVPFEALPADEPGKIDIEFTFECNPKKG